MIGTMVMGGAPRRVPDLRNAGARALAALLALAVLAFGGAALAEAGPDLAGKVNVNTATQEELELLPGIGASRARAVIETRKERGGFKSVDELVEVKGIGEASLERMRPFVTTSGKTTARAPTAR
jgi:competence ComEA-like helix-hairpin-helix protein